MNQGALLAIFASLIFSVMNALVKTIADDIPTGEIVFFRSSIGCLLVLLLMYRHGVAFSREDRPLLVLRGTMGGLYLICYFLQHRPPHAGRRQHAGLPVAVFSPFCFPCWCCVNGSAPTPHFG